MIVQVTNVAGGTPPDNPWCAGKPGLANCNVTFNDTWNLAGGAGCVWGTGRSAYDICGSGEAGCDSQYTTVNVVLRIIEEAGNWYIRIWFYITTVYPPEWAIPPTSFFSLWESDEGATRPLCSELSLSRVYTLISDDTCCDWSGASVET